MTSEEFTQTVRACYKVSKYIVDIDTALPYINDVRKLHSKLQKELEYLLLDPNEFEKEPVKEKIRSIYKEIIIVCNSGQIKHTFFNIPKEWVDFSKSFRKNKIFATYSYNNIDITDLIAYSKKNKIAQSKESDIDVIDEPEVKLNELSFDENIITKEMGELPGGY